MKTMFIPTCLVLFLACTSTPQDEGGEIKEFITDAAPEGDSAVVVGIDDELKTKLSDYFAPGVVEKINAYMADYNGMTAAEQFEKNYRDGMELFSIMYNDLNEPQTEYLKAIAKDYEYWSSIEILGELEQFNGQLGPIEISCAAECTDLDFLFDLTILAEKAKSTTGTSDDDFVALVMAVEGDYGYAGYPGFKSWFNQTWDLGGSSNIGNDTLLNCILRCQEFETNYPGVYAEEIARIREDFADALIYGNNYSYDQETVLGEYDRILKLDFFGADHMKEIKRHYKEIKAGSDQLQFNCATADCIWG